MVNVVAVSALDAASPPRAQIFHRIAPYVSLLPPALLLGMLRIWSLWVAPRHGVYFTVEAVLIIYACFAIVRAVHVHAHSTDSRGSYDAARARKARNAFHGEIGRHWARIAIVVLGLLLIAFGLDVLTADTGAPVSRQRAFLPAVHRADGVVALWLGHRAGVGTLGTATAAPILPRACARKRSRCQDGRRVDARQRGAVRGGVDRRRVAQPVADRAVVRHASKFQVRVHSGDGVECRPGFRGALADVPRVAARRRAAAERAAAERNEERLAA